MSQFFPRPLARVYVPGVSAAQSSAQRIRIADKKKMRGKPLPGQRMSQVRNAYAQPASLCIPIWTFKREQTECNLIGIKNHGAFLLGQISA